MNGVTVTELHSQDGYDWPNGVRDERWPAEHDRGAITADVRAKLEPKCRRCGMTASACAGQRRLDVGPFF